MKIIMEGNREKKEFGGSFTVVIKDESKIILYADAGH